ncbi:MAG: calcium-binding protein [Cyanobacteria bacterium J06621_11]
MPSIDDILQRAESRTKEIRSRVGSRQNSTRQTGTSGKDFLIADTSEDSVLNGRGGNDRLFGRFGNDRISGGAGNDIIDGGFGDDVLFGNGGDDQIFGKIGNDTLDGGGGNDGLFGGMGDDSLDGGNGEDQLNGDVGSDTVIGGRASDILVGGSNAGTGNPLEIDQLIGGVVTASGDVIFDNASDTFVLGDNNGSFYARGGFDDYAIIFDFEPGIDRLELSQVALDAGNISLGSGSFFTDIDTVIFDQDDPIAVIVGVDLA